MKSNARTNTVEVLFSDTEFTALNRLCTFLGVHKSPFLRDYANRQVRLNDMSALPGEESRHCRGIGKVASRASIGTRQVHRRAICPNRATFAGAPIPRRV